MGDQHYSEAHYGPMHWPDSMVSYIDVDREAVLIERTMDLLQHLHPAWHAEAACRGQTSTMFPERGDNEGSRRARQICARCEVIEQCREWARSLPTNEPGIIAGMSSTERRQAKAARVDQPVRVRANTAIAV